MSPAASAPIAAGVATALLPLFAGWPASVLLPRTLRRSLASRLAFAWLLGAAWCGGVALALSRVGDVPLRRPALLPAILVPWIFVAAASPRALRVDRLRVPSLAGLGAGLVVGTTGLVLLALSLTTPVFDWDGLMTWIPQARLIRAGETATPGAVTDRWTWVSHPQYPPCLALVQVAGQEIVSAPDDERAGRGVHPLFFVSFLVVLHRAIRVLTLSAPAAAAAASLAAMTPFLAFETHGGAAGAYADVPLAAFLGAGLAVLLCGGRRSASGIAAGLLLSGAVLTKREGAPLVAGLLAVVLVLALASRTGRDRAARRARLRRIAAVAIPLALLVAATTALLVAYRSRIPNRFDEDYAAIVAKADLSPSVLARKAAAVLPQAAAKLVAVRAWGLLWPLVAVLLLLRPRALRSPAGVAAAMLAVAPVALGSTAYLVHWDPVGLMETTFDRFLVQGSFGTFLLLGLLASGAGKRPTPARASG